MPKGWQTHGRNEYNYNGFSTERQGRRKELLKKFLVGMVVLMLLYGQIVKVEADPIISLIGSTQFQSAISDGRIKGVDPVAVDARTLANLVALGKAYGVGANIGKTQVSTDVNGLISATGNASGRGKSQVGAWSYQGSDPDWTNFCVDFDLFLPLVALRGQPGIDTATLAVIDVAGRVEFWQWDNTALSIGNQNFKFPFTSGLGAGGSTSFFQDPGFDITQGLILQVSYQGLLTPIYPPTPPTHDPLEPISLWTGTDRLTTVCPEPGAWLSFAIGGIGLGMMWKRGGRRKS